MSIGEDLRQANVGLLKTSEPLSRHCTWKIGGPADILVEPHDSNQIARIVRYLKKNKLNYIVIGEGSNLLFDDSGFRGVVIKLGRQMSGFAIEGEFVRAQAGVAVPRLARAVGLAGLSGIEHTVGIPGTLGGLVAMNGGSQRKNIGDVIDSVNVIDINGDMETLNRTECGFSYRSSVFQSAPMVIIAVRLRLEYGDTEYIRKQMLHVLRTRSAKFPRHIPNCGSVFSSTTDMYNTVGPPGKLIEEAGLKGCRMGDAEVSRLHANFIVNKNSAGSSDVLRLIKKIREDVHKNTGFWMPCEVKYVMPNGHVKAAHEFGS